MIEKITGFGKKPEQNLLFGKLYLLSHGKVPKFSSRFPYKL